MNKIAKEDRSIQMNNGFSDHGITPPEQGGCTIAQYAEMTLLGEGFLKGRGMTDLHYCGQPAVSVPYFGESGQELSVSFRVSTGASNPFKWRKGSKAVPYGLDLLSDARAEGQVFLCCTLEDALTLIRWGEPALALPGTRSWKEEWATYLEGVERIYVVLPHGHPTGGAPRWLADSSLWERARTICLDGYESVHQLYLSDPKGFGEEWGIIVRDAVHLQAEALLADRSTVEEAWINCRELACEEDILGRFASDIVQHGLAGEERAAKLLYLAVTSRLLEAPVSVAVKGVSSTGKSYASRKVLDFFPPSAYYVLSGFSERALIYSEEPLVHRTLVVHEAAGIHGDLATYLLRTILSEGHIRYETVVKGENGPEGLLIVREGPTGLLISTTAVSLHDENETRLLSVTTTDTPEQTRSILLAMAEEEREEVDFLPWHSLQTWLEDNNNVVSVPFGKTLAEMVNPAAVRLRRDFRSLLGLIQAHALLHQVRRGRDEKERIVATIGDYRAVYGLVADWMEEGIQASVPATVRETVETVRVLSHPNRFQEGVRPTELTKAMGLDKATISRRVKQAISLGYLRSADPRSKRVDHVMVGEPLPADVELLPSPEALAKRCAVAQEEGFTHPLPPASGTEAAPSPEDSE